MSASPRNGSDSSSGSVHATHRPLAKKARVHVSVTALGGDSSPHAAVSRCSLPQIAAMAGSAVNGLWSSAMVGEVNNPQRAIAGYAKLFGEEDDAAAKPPSLAKNNEEPWRSKQDSKDHNKTNTKTSKVNGVTVSL